MATGFGSLSRARSFSEAASSLRAFGAWLLNEATDNAITSFYKKCRRSSAVVATSGSPREKKSASAHRIISPGTFAARALHLNTALCKTLTSMATQLAAKAVPAQATVFRTGPASRPRRVVFVRAQSQGQAPQAVTFAFAGAAAAAILSVSRSRHT